MRLIFIIFLFYFCYLPIAAQQNNYTIEISLLTCSSGDESYTSFGHSAIRVIDKKRNKDIVYDYGVFDFDTPNFMWRFMKGNLDYKLSVRKTDRFLRSYIRDRRGVIQQRINLPEEDLTRIFDLLKENQRPEHRYYKYNFLHDNCSTRIRDLLLGLKVLKLGVHPNQMDKTFRDYLKNYLTNKLWLAFGIDLLLGLETDQVMNFEEQMFLPDNLSQNLSHYEFTENGVSKKLLSPPVRLLETEKKEVSWMIFQPIAVFGLLLVVLILLSKWQPKVIRSLFLFLCFAYGLAGILLLFLWLGTEHTATKMNWNLLWLNPIYLLYPFVRSGRIKLWLMRLFLMLNIGIILCWCLIPQDLNVGIIPLAGIFVYWLYRNGAKRV